MALFLMRFWPVLIPLLAYVIWMLRARRCARKAGCAMPHFFRDGPWFWTLVACLGLAVAMFMLFGLSNEGNKGEYVPPHLENGAVIPGTVQP